MDSAHSTLERIGDRVSVPEPAYERFLERRDRKRRNSRITATVIGIVVAIASAVLWDIGSSGMRVVEQRGSPTIAPRGSPLIAFEGGLAPGRYWVQRGPMRISFRIPDGWSSFHDLAVLGPHETAVAFWTVDTVTVDPCHWSGRERDPGITVDGLVRALADHPGATTPADVTLAGYQGRLMEVQVPTDLRIKTCDPWGPGNHEYISWWMNGGARYHQGPGQIDRLWILDVHGERLVVDASFFPGTPPGVRAQIKDIVDSVQIT